MSDSPTTEELIAGLLRRARDARNVTGGWGFDEAILFEASASSLEALTAENERLHSIDDQQMQIIGDQGDRIAALTARLARLEGAAKPFIDWCHGGLYPVDGLWRSVNRGGTKTNHGQDPDVTFTDMWAFVTLRAALSPEQKEGT